MKNGGAVEGEGEGGGAGGLANALWESVAISVSAGGAHRSATGDGKCANQGLGSEQKLHEQSSSQVCR